MNTISHTPVTYSKYLPLNYDPQGIITLVAGKGDYPILLASKIQALGIPLKLLAFEGETNLDFYESFKPEDKSMVKVGQLGKFLKAIKQFGSKYVLLAGQITPRRLFHGLHLDLKALIALAKLKERNAHTIFGIIIQELTDINVTTLDARSFLDDELAHEGVMVGKLTLRQEHIDLGIRIAKSIAELDIGQGVVVSKGTVLAVEAFEGTDAMLQRAGTFKAQDMLFVKTMKPNHDYRLDVPVFGLKTIETLKAAGIYTVLLETTKTIILNKEDILKHAKQAGITLVGYSLSEKI